MKRPGRFDRTIIIPLPSFETRKEILKYYLGKTNLAKRGIDLDKIASVTGQMTGADLKNLVDTAGLQALHKNRSILRQIDLEEAFERIKMGLKRAKGISTDDELNRTAFHEAGHALTALLTKGSNTLHKVTILPVGQALGFTGFLPDPHSFNSSKEELKAILDTAVGGRAAEEIVFGNQEISSGCGSDLSSASKIAYEMACNLGMVKDDNWLSMDYKNLSEKGKFEVDEDVQKLLTDSLRRTKTLLESNRYKLDILAQELLVRETLTADEVKRLLQLPN